MCGSVEGTLNKLRESEVQKLTQRRPGTNTMSNARAYRSGHYIRNLTTTSRDVILKVSKLKEISLTGADSLKTWPFW